MKKIKANDPETKSPDLVAENVARLKALFPELITEGKQGVSVNVDVLKGLVGDKTVTDADEKYGLNWHGKRQARQLALTPSTGTLRPCPEESVDWDTTQNLMIEGDNLEVLKLLQKSYAGKVKLIYIDPPYNTGKDFVYPDNFQDNIRNYLELTGQVEGGQKISSNTEASGRFHTDWLNMMYPRLKLARNLLKDDGVILISIDDHEVDHVKRVLAEVFGEECFVGCFVWNSKTTGGHDAKDANAVHEYVLCFGKNADKKGEFIGLLDSGTEYPHRDPISGRTFKWDSLWTVSHGYTENCDYPIPAPDGTVVWPWTCHKDGKKVKGRARWFWSKETYQTEKDELLVRKTDGGWKVYKKVFGGSGTPIQTLITKANVGGTSEGKGAVEELFGQTGVFENPKPPRLIKCFVERMSLNALVVDFFAGSGTTGHAVMAQNAVDGGNRRYILVQLPEPLDPQNKDQKVAADFCDKLKKPRNIAELTKERLRRAGKKIRKETPLFKGDLGFRVFKLASSNIQAWEPDREKLAETLEASVDHLKTDRTENDILFELLLKLGLDLTVPIEEKTIAGKAVHSIGAGTLMVCLAPKITRKDAEPLALGIVKWHKALAPAGESTVVFRDSAFADDVAKTNLAAILEQHGLTNVRSL